MAAIKLQSEIAHLACVYRPSEVSEVLGGHFAFGIHHLDLKVHRIVVLVQHPLAYLRPYLTRQVQR
jgi:hypothetical protein